MTIKEIQHELERFEPEQKYEPGDLVELVRVMLHLSQHLERIEATAAHAAAVAGCLANGIKPD